MNETVKGLVEDLERGFDGNPEESARELARMDEQEGEHEQSV